MEEKKPEVGEPRLIFESRKFYLYEMDVEFPDGHQEVWEFVQPKWKAGVQILPLTDQQELILIREYRGAAGRFVLRVPTGSMEDDENPEESARRELEEEVGFQAEKLELIEKRESTSSYFKGTLYVYLATGLSKAAIHRDPGEQNMEVLIVNMDRAFEMIQNLEIENPQTIYSILWLRKYLSNQ